MREVHYFTADALHEVVEECCKRTMHAAILSSDQHRIDRYAALLIPYIQTISPLYANKTVLAEYSIAFPPEDNMVGFSNGSSIVFAPMYMFSRMDRSDRRPEIVLVCDEANGTDSDLFCGETETDDVQTDFDVIDEFLNQFPIKERDMA